MVQMLAKARNWLLGRNTPELYYFRPAGKEVIEEYLIQ